MYHNNNINKGHNGRGAKLTGYFTGFSLARIPAVLIVDTDTDSKKKRRGWALYTRRKAPPSAG